MAGKAVPNERPAVWTALPSPAQLPQSCPANNVPDTAGGPGLLQPRSDHRRISVTRRTRPPQGVYPIAELARREGIDPKTARHRLRTYFGGTLADLGIREWTYGPEDLHFVLSIIRPDHGRSAGLPARTLAESAAPPANTPRTKISDPYSWPRQPRAKTILPDRAGVYALFLKGGSSLPGIAPLAEGLIYIGRAQHLVRRCHFRGKTEGHSPRRSLAALLWHPLGLAPELGANGNCKLDQPSERRLDDWMHANLLLALQVCDDFARLEGILIRRFSPPLNLTKCAQSAQHTALKNLRATMRASAMANR